MKYFTNLTEAQNRKLERALDKGELPKKIKDWELLIAQNHSTIESLRADIHTLEQFYAAYRYGNSFNEFRKVCREEHGIKGNSWAAITDEFNNRIAHMHDRITELRERVFKWDDLLKMARELQREQDEREAVLRYQASKKPAPAEQLTTAQKLKELSQGKNLKLTTREACNLLDLVLRKIEKDNKELDWETVKQHVIRQLG